MEHVDQKTVVVVSTGGTIASRWQGTGYAAEAPGQEVLSSAPVPDGVAVRVVDLFTVNSPRLTTAHQLAVVRAVHEALADPGVDGVVVTHGTDTLEETAFLLDLHHDDPRPVVLTGAQRPLDDADGDAAGNLHDALLTASRARGAGVLVVFDGMVHAARGTVKAHTVAADAFCDPSGTPLGKVGFGAVSPLPPAQRRTRLPLPPADAAAPRVDIVMHHSDADPLLLEAAVSAGAQGLVLVGTGAGNATPEFAEAVARAVRAGVLVAVTTRVPAGPVVPLYTGGGAVDLAAAGAVLTGTLRAGQARIAVLAALLAEDGAQRRTEVLRGLVGPAQAGTGAAAEAEGAGRAA
ncbi:asparaginase [Streptacidiphilus sp. ASG 303]|uniref:asparaginase n=1 Tax=Streptacidiphilus sp. ASG 303 TaxID=2896847 RepID=UPI001E52598B|nr:asparaginase [Streptacidiphilus sp. ASG 303]MCD0482770.1 asparaginase [Streptacidiphilus sp. ASG 303]